ncbi:MAG: hypothetical protein WBE95_29285, partial [Trebonia sp.]|uniref:hypothetical protein n=1 Tax=Trebonia sp. TaxID=2767075 RepID=UPI003C73F900
RRFRAGIGARFGADEAAAWRYAAATLTPLRPRIRDLARALLVYPRHLPYPVTAAIAGFSGPSSAGGKSPDCDMGDSPSPRPVIGQAGIPGKDRFPLS